jgi:hypothetical protein
MEEKDYERINRLKKSKEITWRGWLLRTDLEVKQ